MYRKIAILRGINVGGKRKILMADLKSICEKLGLKEVKTYIQSGNIIFNSDEQIPILENTLEKAITEKFGFDVPVIIRSSIELQTVVEKNPFFEKDTDINHLFLTFLKDSPDLVDITKAKSFNFEPDKFEIIDKDIFGFCVGKYHLSKLTNQFFERQLKGTATTRNWRTVLKLLELSKN